VHIQPYFPEQIEIEGNVASESYNDTLRFIRLTSAGHAVSVAAVVAVAVLMEPLVSAKAAVAVFLACLLALTLVRRLSKSRKADLYLSIAILVPTLWSLGTSVRIVSDSGSPVWILGASYCFALLYTVFCGRDHSFVGQFVISSLATAVLVFSGPVFDFFPWSETILWFVVAEAYLFFYVYDSAALLSRRKTSEHVTAVADLYRDLLNFLTYTVRIVAHWRKFRFI